MILFPFETEVRAFLNRQQPSLLFPHFVSENAPVSLEQHVSTPSTAPKWQLPAKFLFACRRVHFHGNR